MDVKNTDFEKTKHNLCFLILEGVIMPPLLVMNFSWIHALAYLVLGGYLVNQLMFKEAYKGNPGALASSLLSRLAEQRGHHANDKAHKQADRRVGILFQKEGQQIGNSQETDDTSDKNRDQLRNMGFKIGKGMGDQLHNRLIDTEDYAQHSAGDSGKHSAQANQRPLKNSKNELCRTKSG